MSFGVTGDDDVPGVESCCRWIEASVAECVEHVPDVERPAEVVC
jgi:hypothetical protein